MFTKGDKVRSTLGVEWEVLAVDGEQLWLRRDVTDSYATVHASFVEKIPEYPERWINVYREGHGSRDEADRIASSLLVADKRIGVIHLAADGTLTMEAP